MSELKKKLCSAKQKTYVWPRTDSRYAQTETNYNVWPKNQVNTTISVMWPTDQIGKALGFKLCLQHDGKRNSEQVANKVLKC